MAEEKEPETIQVLSLKDKHFSEVSIDELQQYIKPAPQRMAPSRMRIGRTSCRARVKPAFSVNRIRRLASS